MVQAADADQLPEPAGGVGRAVRVHHYPNTSTGTPIFPPGMATQVRAASVTNETRGSRAAMSPAEAKVVHACNEALTAARALDADAGNEVRSAVLSYDS